MFCFRCKKKLDLPQRKVGFKDMCPFCEADLHVCKNCKHHMISKPNQCFVPNTEYVRDREKYNFCEEFVFKENLNSDETDSLKDISKKLLKDESEDDDKNRGFDSLFKE